MKMKKKLTVLFIGAACALNAADNQPLPADYSWIEHLRTDHPRIFINADLLPKIRKWAEKIGYRQVILDAENFRIDPDQVVQKRGMVGERKQKRTRPVTVARTYENEAMNCALAYLLTGEKKYAEKTWVFLDHNLAVYRDCAEKRTLINWYGMLRNFNMAALDWVWNASDPARCRKYVKDFVDVNIRYARHGWFGPFYGVNGGSGKASGFYGDSNTELFMGLLAYREGVCDELAVDMLKKGYDKYRACMNFRDAAAEDDGILTTIAMGYSAGQYPFVSYDFLFLWRAAFRDPVELPKLKHLLYFSEWYQWNMLPGKGEAAIREFGIGDNAKTTMRMFSISQHLYVILGIYGKSYPEAAVHIARAIEHMDGKFDPDHYREGELVKRAQTPKYCWGEFMRKYLAYDFENVRIPPETETPDPSSMVMARHFPAGGLVFMRSGKEPDSVRALFQVGGRLVAHKTRGDENHFSIFRKGYLAIDAGYRYDLWYAPAKYHRSSAAHNTVLIHDPDERFPEDEKQCLCNFKLSHYVWQDTKEQDELFRKHRPYFADAQGGQNKALGGKCLAFSTNPFYSYISGDAGGVYSPVKCKEFNRQFIHLQPDVFIVFDRVESVKAEFKKEWLLHFLEEPTVKGNLTEAKVTDEGGVIRCSSLLPKSGVITKIGGPGREYWGGQVNWDAPKKLLDKVRYGGKWRISLSPATAEKRDYFLNVIEVGDQPLADIRCRETGSEAEVSFVTPDQRTVTVSFSKTGRISGRIRIGKDGKSLCDEQFTERIQEQGGYLF